MNNRDNFKLEIINDRFVINDKVVQLISGATHYFRIHPKQWEDRLKKLKACGLNCVETYVPWNIHEPQLEEFNFDGFCDLERFIQIAQDLNLYVILRPGPYICSEFDGGGLPWWLNNITGMVIRCSNKFFMERCKIFYAELMPRIKPFFSTNGGPIVAIQLENEYDSYGNDKKYLQNLKEIFEYHGADLLFFTSDDSAAWKSNDNDLPDVLKTINFGSQPEEKFDALNKLQPNKPLMCMEFWNGWFDHWGLEHKACKLSKDKALTDVEQILKSGNSLNFYMFNGGTNFGFNNGANLRHKLEPTTTSYDYSAPVSECGDMTDKYYDYKQLISKYAYVNDSIETANPEKIAYGKVELTQSVSLFDTLAEDRWVESLNPLSMEALNQGYGFVLYRTNLTTDCWTNIPNLYISGLRDRAWIFLEEELKGIVTRENAEQGISVGKLKAGMQLDILVENMGRINFGVEILDTKGITGHVRFAEKRHFGWEMMSLPLDDIENINFSKSSNDLNRRNPRFYKGVFTVDKCADTFLLTDGWTKGIAFINGFNLGRYWSIGPQRTLYIPSPLINEGENELVVFELENNQDNQISLIKDASLTSRSSTIV